MTTKIYKYNNIKLHNVKPLESLLTELKNIDNAHSIVSVATQSVQFDAIL